MIGQTISHYPAERDAKKRHKILEKPRHKDASPPEVWRGGQVGEGGAVHRLVRRSASVGGSPTSYL